VSGPAGAARLTAPLLRHATLDSTNAEALRLLAQRTPPFWVLAERQTAGRGRRARPWISPPGNLAVSLALRLAPEGPSPALRSFTAALALAEALEEVSGHALPLALKWPNDVLLEGRKLSGILLEGRSAGRGAPLDLVVGIGVNLIAAPPPGKVAPSGPVPVSLLEATGRRVTPEALLAALDAAFFAREAQLLAEGFAPIREAWLARAHGLGAPVTARLADGRTLAGCFETVDLAGNLVLKTGHGREIVSAADIFFA